jgi:hypothetical protein
LSGGYYFLQQNKEAVPSQSSKKAEPSQSSNKTEPSQSSNKTEPSQSSNNADSKKAAEAAAEAEDALNLIKLLASIEKYKIQEGKLVAGRSIALLPGPFRIFMQMGQPIIDIDGRKITFNQATNELMDLYSDFFKQWENKYIFEINISLDENPANNKSYLDIIKNKALDNTLKKATPESIAANKKQIQKI